MFCKQIITTCFILFNLNRTHQIDQGIKFYSKDALDGLNVDDFITQLAQEMEENEISIEEENEDSSELSKHYRLQAALEKVWS